MRTVPFAASLLLAVCLATPGHAAPDQQIAGPVASKKKLVVQATKPTWEQCFDMSTTRGFNHGRREWHQSILDCQDGKIPLQ